MSSNVKPFHAEIAKSGRASCKSCKEKIPNGKLRMAKVLPNPFGDGFMKNWFHIPCIFEVFSKQRATTRKIDSIDDIEGWNDLKPNHQDEILSRLPDSVKVKKLEKSDDNNLVDSSGSKNIISKDVSIDYTHRDSSLREFRRLCADISNTPGYIDKTNILKKFITKGYDQDKFKGDLYLLIKLLLPGVIKRVYNLQSRQIIKLFSRIFNTDQEKMLEDLEQGDVAETIRKFFEDSNTSMRPINKASINLKEVDEFLEELSKLSKEDEQILHFKSIIPRCTANDLKMIIRFIKHDLRINAGAKHILDAVHPDAYEAFQSSRNLNSVLDQLLSDNTKLNAESKMVIGIITLTPVLPMLAAPCKSADEALEKCPNGIFADIKYDGERVQIHKKGNEFKFFSRSLKPVLPHKVKNFEKYIPKAFPFGKDLILDSEVLLIDTNTSKPLPFGTLGVHKKNEFKDANECLFVFDCIYYNGDSLVDKSMIERRKILQENMNPIENRIIFSEMQEINTKMELEKLMTKVFREGLEGLVLKDKLSKYEPGKRHWLKIKKDYLFGGAMADSADLVVLGAWYGTGQKGGKMSVFLMGCYDTDDNIWCTVTKVHGGHDDATLDSLQTELEMKKISKDPNKIPNWLKCTKTMVPDFVAKDPKKQPVWEITGAEFSKHVVHTADGISIRFPRVTRIRNDKNWKSATNLKELKELVAKSKETTNFSLIGFKDSKLDSANSSPVSSPEKKSCTKPLITIKYQIKNPLPDVFRNIRMIIPDRLPETSNDEKYPSRNDLIRYFMAYGGEVLEKDEQNEVTHYIKTNNSDIGNPNAKPVDIGWLWSSIRTKTLQPYF